MLQAKAGEMSSMSVLFDRYHVRLYNFFYQQTRDKGQSEDLTQNVFERIIKYRDRYEPKRSFTSWIYTVARNVHMDLYRKKSPTLPGDDKVMALADVPETYHEDLSAEKARLKVAMTHLSSEQQQLIWLTRYEKLKYAQVADMMDCSVGSVKVKIHRTMKALKSAYYKINIDE